MGARNQDASSRNIGSPTRSTPSTRKGRPRSERAHQAILAAARELLVEEGFAHLHLEHVAARAGVGKATIYRRWASKEQLVQELLSSLAAPYIPVGEAKGTRQELLAAVINPIRALTETDFGPVLRALLSQIATNPSLGDPFRATVVHARRAEIARVIARGIERGDLRPDADPDVATELLVGPVYFRLMFGGDLDRRFAELVVESVMKGFEARAARDTSPAAPDDAGSPHDSVSTWRAVRPRR